MADQDAQTPAGSEPPPLSVLRWDESSEGPAVVLLDQTRLPAEEAELVCADVPALVRAIRMLAVRGAPLLGIAGGYGVALAAARGEDVEKAAELLERARPTAVNLGYGARRVARVYQAAVAGGAGPEGAAPAGAVAPTSVPPASTARAVPRARTWERGVMPPPS